MLVHHTEKDSVRQSRTKQIRALSIAEQISVHEPTTGRFIVYKERGETLAVLVKRFRNEQNIESDVPITYAGRLDPMAEGVVLLLVGEARFQKDEYLKLPKTYEVEVLFGIGTDTNDMLGLITGELYKDFSREDIAAVVDRIDGITELSYPLYSSVLVEGVPLFVHARAGKTVAVPTKKVEITAATLLHVRTAPVEAVVRDAIVDIGKVEGDFRQVAIMKQWQQCIQTHKEPIVSIATIRVTASSGTYMRSIASWMGKELGVPALAYRIKRTKIGEYRV